MLRGMKRALALALVLTAVVAFAGIRLGNTATQVYSLSDCDGGNTVSVPEGSYAMSITDAKTFLCINDAGCAAGGWPVTAGLVMSVDFSQTTPISCRSPDLTGDVSLLKTP